MFDFTSQTPPAAGTVFFFLFAFSPHCSFCWKKSSLVPHRKSHFTLQGKAPIESTAQRALLSSKPLSTIPRLSRILYIFDTLLVTWRTRLRTVRTLWAAHHSQPKAEAPATCWGAPQGHSCPGGCGPNGNLLQFHWGPQASACGGRDKTWDAPPGRPHQSFQALVQPQPPRDGRWESCSQSMERASGRVLLQSHGHRRAMRAALPRTCAQQGTIVITLQKPYGKLNQP